MIVDSNRGQCTEAFRARPQCEDWKDTYLLLVKNFYIHTVNYDSAEGAIAIQQE